MQWKEKPVSEKEQQTGSGKKDVSVDHIREFFSFFEEQGAQEELWIMLKRAFTNESDNTASKDRSNMIFLYEQLSNFSIMYGCCIRISLRIRRNKCLNQPAIFLAKQNTSITMFNEAEWLKLVFLLADTQQWLDDMAKEAIATVPIHDKRKFL